MIGTEFLKGQGLGNQLFCYVSARCFAIDHGCRFGTAGQHEFANNIHSNRGLYFMDLYLGEQIDCTEDYRIYHEAEHRIKYPFSRHDMTYGCSIGGADPLLLDRIPDNTLVYGNLQDEKYFLKHRNEICNWLKLKPEYNDFRFSDDNLCILNMRGGEYVGNGELFLRRNYWESAMKHMRQANKTMQFIIITEDVETANTVLPKIKAYHFGMGEDYAILHNACNVILSNSSFAFFPIFTSSKIKRVIAPKYWARHNVSDGFWASEQNIYSGWQYMDRKGYLFSSDECRRELEIYKKKKSGILNSSGNFVNRLYYSISGEILRNQFKAKKMLCKVRQKTADRRV